ncbi:MAG: hypothetical protein J7647_14725 [Cyanobacteria bacterium SBLK]|nr:hypothetical protein [Cyanobacteria bacterium SBLK]
MLIFVIVFNCLLAIINFYIAWKILRLRKTLANATQTLISLDRTLYNALHPTPHYIYIAQKGAANLRDRYGNLEGQLQKVQRLLNLLNLILKIWTKTNITIGGVSGVGR